MFKRILVPVDGSDTSNRALLAALQLARESDARVRIVHLFEAFDHLSGFEHGVQAWDQARLQANALIDQARAVAAAAGIAAEGKLLDAPGLRLGEAVAEEARASGADLVVVGTVGRRGAGRMLLGSGAEQVIRLCPVPVLAIRATEAVTQA